MSEPDVTLTNLIIVIQCLAFAWACVRRRRNLLRDALAAFFAATAMASATASVVHGYLPDRDDAGHAVFWSMTMLSVVIASAALGVAAGELARSPDRNRNWRLGALALVVTCLAVAILLGARDFALAVTVYVGASLWLAVALVTRWRERRSQPLLVGAAGLVLAIIAGVLQQLRHTPVPELLSHNAWYHALQIVALAAFFVGCRDVLSERKGG